MYLGFPNWNNEWQQFLVIQGAKAHAYKIGITNDPPITNGLFMASYFFYFVASYLLEYLVFFYKQSISFTGAHLKFNNNMERNGVNCLSIVDCPFFKSFQDYFEA